MLDALGGAILEGLKDKFDGADGVKMLEIRAQLHEGAWGQIIVDSEGGEDCADLLFEIDVASLHLCRRRVCCVSRVDSVGGGVGV